MTGAMESEGGFRSLVGLAHIAIVLATFPDRGLRLAEEELRLLNFEEQRKILVDYLVSSSSIPSWLGDVTSRVHVALWQPLGPCRSVVVGGDIGDPSVIAIFLDLTWITYHSFQSHLPKVQDG